MNKKVTLTILGVLFVALVLVILFGFVFTGKTVQEEPIKLGMTTALTGSYAVYGEKVVRGITEAVDEANSNHALKENIQLVIEDNQADPKQAVSAYQKFKMENIKIVFGSFSGLVGAMNPLSKEDKIILMYSAMTSSYAKDNEYAFMVYADSVREGEFLANYAANEGKVTFVRVKNPSTDLILEELKKKVEITDYAFDLKETDYRTAILKLKESNTKKIIFGVYSNQFSNFIKQCIELGYYPEIIATSDGATNEVKNSIEELTANTGIKYSTLAYGTEDQNYLFSYDLAKVLITAMKSCEKLKQGADNPECLKQEVPKVKIQGKSGIVDMANGRIALVNPKLYVVRNKQLILTN